MGRNLRAATGKLPQKVGHFCFLIAFRLREELIIGSTCYGKIVYQGG